MENKYVFILFGGPWDIKDKYYNGVANWKELLYPATCLTLS